MRIYHASGLFDYDTPVGQIARACPATMAVLENFDIDFACSGGQSLRAAAEAAGVQCDQALQRLNATSEQGPLEPEPTLDDLVLRLLPDAHEEERARLINLSRVLAASGPARSAVHARLQRLASRLESTIRRHMEREEHDLFPAIERLAGTDPATPPVSIVRRIYVEFVEHDTIHDLLVKVRELRLRATLEGCDEKLTTALLEFERETLRHIHIENNVLLPLALEAENRLKAAHV